MDKILVEGRDSLGHTIAPRTWHSEYVHFAGFAHLCKQLKPLRYGFAVFLVSSLVIVAMSSEGKAGNTEEWTKSWPRVPAPSATP